MRVVVTIMAIGRTNALAKCNEKILHETNGIKNVTILVVVDTYIGRNHSHNI